MAEKTADKPTIVRDDDQGVPLRLGGRAGRGGAAGQQLAIPADSAVLAVRNMVIFPGMALPLRLGRAKSQRLINDLLPDQRVLGAVCQKSGEVEEPGPDDLYDVGTAVMVLKVLRNEQNEQTVLLQGLARMRVQEWLQQEPYLRARIEVLEDQPGDVTELEALVVNARSMGTRLVHLSPTLPDEAKVVLNNLQDATALGDFLASNLDLDVATRQELLAERSVNRRLQRVCEELQRQLQVLELSDKIQSQVKEKIGQSQRQYFLQEQLKAIREELGQQDERTAELEQLREQVEQANMPEAVRKEADRELGRLGKLPPVSPEYNVIRTYLEVLSELPWRTSTEDKVDVRRARKVLDEDHHDLDKVKRRVLEYLAVRQLSPESRGPILCFVGPPGVGKTSLGQSIARAMGRKFIRMSLGGMRDEAELRGHRRTYIGALPGRIIQEIRKAGVNNPLFMLDEVDKIGQDFRGDPTSALLEILDPAQNHSFQDNYLNVPFDLSRVLFIGTANYMAPVPPALRDRMEVIELPGYTREDKLQIAKQYLVPRQMSENGLTASRLRWRAEGLGVLIDRYTREPGVRELERKIGALCRAVAAQIVEGKAKSRTVNARLVREVLGPRTYEDEAALRTSVPGVATGLAYTPAGGVIMFVEAACYPGKGQLTLTGQIGDVMQESARAAMSLLKSRTDALGLDGQDLPKLDVHVHVPAGAVPKDGPSAGVAIFTSLVSLLRKQEVRRDVAMTGEVTLRGLVLPVGGIKEKVLAAKQAGIRTVILPERNRKDLEEIPPAARKHLSFVFARTVEDVLSAALRPEASGGPSGKQRSSGRSRDKHRARAGA